MSGFQSRLRKLDTEREDRMFASKTAALLLFAPCIIALAFGFFKVAVGVDSSDALVTASLLSLVCGSLDLIRKKIIRQDKAIQHLQERYEMLEHKAMAAKSYEGQE